MQKLGSIYLGSIWVRFCKFWCQTGKNYLGYRRGAPLEPLDTIVLWCLRGSRGPLIGPPKVLKDFPQTRTCSLRTAHANKPLKLYVFTDIIELFLVRIARCTPRYHSEVMEVVLTKTRSKEVVLTKSRGKEAALRCKEVSLNFE